LPDWYRPIFFGCFFLRGIESFGDFTFQSVPEDLLTLEDRKNERFRVRVFGQLGAKFGFGRDCRGRRYGQKRLGFALRSENRSGVTLRNPSVP